MLFKNVICGFHAAYLSSLHPRSLFIHISRGLYDTCASILRTRRERYGSYEAWWSLKPSTYPFDTASGDAAAEVVRQVIDCRTEIDEELSRPGVCGLRITYEMFCSSPTEVLGCIREAIAAMGTELPAVQAPELRAASGPPLPRELEERLKALVEARIPRRQ